MADNHITDQPTLQEEDLKPARTYTVTYARKHGDDRARGVYEIMRGELIVDADGSTAFDTRDADVVAVETTSEIFPHDTLNMARKHATAEAPSRRRSTHVPDGVSTVPSEQRGKASCAVSRAPAFEWRYYVEMYQAARRCREIAARYYASHEIAVPDYLNAWLEQQEDTESCR